MKISILLPYKENFSPSYPGAVSIFVRDTTLVSKYKNNITIYGNTNFKKKLLNNYINLKLKNAFIQSKNKLFVENFLKHEKKENSDLIEIHNRPSYVNVVKKKTSSKIFLYFFFPIYFSITFWTIFFGYGHFLYLFSFTFRLF